MTSFLGGADGRTTKDTQKYVTVHSITDGVLEGTYRLITTKPEIGPVSDYTLTLKARGICEQRIATGTRVINNRGGWELYGGLFECRLLLRDVVLQGRPVIDELLPNEEKGMWEMIVRRKGGRLVIYASEEMGLEFARVN